MWLLDATDLTNIYLREFHEKNTPPYAILSHTWLEDNSQEVSFQDVRARVQPYKNKLGYEKVHWCCQQAKLDGLRYCWIDTCCINKDSSAELSEAINTMFKWYQQARICYAYLTDVDSESPNVRSQFAKSRWFTRGWTLQELVAPSNVVFYGKYWGKIGTKASLCNRISKITGIDIPFLVGQYIIQSASVAVRMSWASRRETTRTEDIAYCLLGIFNVSMGLLYGEREKAFVRLQEEIIKESEDQSLFAWVSSDKGDSGYQGILARSPRDFAQAHHIFHFDQYFCGEPFAITHRGLRIHLPFERGQNGELIGLLGCQDTQNDNLLGVVLTSPLNTLEQHEQLQRVPGSELARIPVSDAPKLKMDWATVFINKAGSSIGKHRSPSGYHNCFGITLDTLQIGGGASIMHWYPDCQQDPENSAKLVLNPLSLGYHHALVVVQQPQGTHLCLAFGFAARVSGSIDTEKYWAASVENGLSARRVNSSVEDMYRNGLGQEDEIKAKLKVLWEQFQSPRSPRQWIDSKGIEILTRDYCIDVQVGRKKRLGYVSHEIFLRYSYK